MARSLSLAAFKVRRIPRRDHDGGGGASVTAVTVRYRRRVRSDVFASVPRHELRLAGRRRTFTRDETVFHRDDPGDSVHHVISGRFAARIVTPLGETATLAVYGPGEVFGLLAVLAGPGRRTATMIALEPAETIAIPGSRLTELRAQYPAIGVAIEALLTEQLATTSDRLVEALYTPVNIRVRARLRALAELYRTGPDEAVVVPLSQEHLAGLAGTTRETVNRILNDEVARGSVLLARRRITVFPERL
jgi:CRP-like cAMP-binding protein